MASRRRPTSRCLYIWGKSWQDTPLGIGVSLAEIAEIPFPVIPSEAAQRAAQSRDLLLSRKQQNGSLHSASLRSASVGMTEVLATWDSLGKLPVDCRETAKPGEQFSPIPGGSETLIVAHASLLP